MNPVLAIGRLAAVAGLVLAAGCSASGSGPDATPGLNPAVKRFQASQRAFDRAHPGLVRCQVTVSILLGKTITAIEEGHAAGLDPARVQAQYGAGSPIYQTFIQVDGQEIGYVKKHGLVGAIAAFAGQIERDCLRSLAGRQAGQSPAPPSSGFTAALALWAQSSYVAQAFCASHLLRAASDLAAVGVARYAGAIRALRDLAAVPPTGVTAAQAARAKADVAALDRFFGTPRVTSCL